MAVFSAFSASPTIAAPSPDDLLDWSSALWQTSAVTVSASEIRALRDGRELIFRGAFSQASVGSSWDGTITEVEVKWPATLNPGDAPRAVMTGLSIQLAEHVTVFAGGGVDQFQPQSSNYSALIITTLSGADNMTGSIANDSINGYAGNDTLRGGLGRDTLMGGSGQDVFLVASSELQNGEIYNGGSELDTLRLVGPSAQFDLRAVTLTGIESLDIATDDPTGAVAIFLAGSQIGGSGLTGLASNGRRVSLDIFGSVNASALAIDAAQNFAVRYVGTALADTISTAATGGPSGSVAIEGGAGADTIVGGGGNDTVFLDAADLPTTGPSESISFGGGRDVLALGGGAFDFRRHQLSTDYEEIRLSAGVTSVTLNASQLFTGSGSLLSTTGETSAFLNIMQATWLDLSAVTILRNGFGAAARPIIEGTDGPDSIIGSSADDVIRGMGNSDTLSGGDGDDIIVQRSDGLGLAADDWVVVDGGLGSDIFVVEGRVAGRLVNVEHVVFGDAPPSTPSLLGRLSLSSVDIAASAGFRVQSITGKAGQQAISVSTPNAPVGLVDLSGITFSQWTPLEDTVTIDVFFNEGTVTGSAVADVVTIYRQGQRVVHDLGGGEDRLNLSELTSTYSGGFNGGAGTDTLALTWQSLAPPVEVNLLGFTLQNVERLEITDVMAASLPGSFFGASGIRTVQVFNPSTPYGPQPVTISGASIDLSATTWADARRPSETLIIGTGGGDVVRLGAFDVTRVSVGDGHDSVVGSTSADLVQGGAGEDTLSGAGGADTLLGGQGNDTLIGGAGKDLMTGGGGLDHMRLTRLADSGVTFATRDVINTFAHGDKIDLSAIDARTNVAGDQAFSFIGAAAFSGVSGQLRFDMTNISATGVKAYTVFGDVNGDRAADFSLQIFTSPTADRTGQPQSWNLFAWDFIL
jgi:Ca2+-binding RTX toxin-like protein